jgi:DNA-directed RNA polymerase subunit RPC12/RpoP
MLNRTKKSCQQPRMAFKSPWRVICTLAVKYKWSQLMSDNAEYLKCPCDYCGQELECPADGVGTEIECPTCHQKTMLHRVVARTTEPPPTMAAEPKSPSPAPLIGCSCLHCGQHIEFPASAVGDTIQCPQCGQPTMLHRPAARTIQSARIVPAPKGAEAGKATGIRLNRRIAIAGLIVVCCFGAAAWAFQIWRVHEATRTALTGELRLLDADLNTGINENDFLREVVRVRAAYDGAKANLTRSQNERFAEIELDMAACAYFWGKQISLGEDYPWEPYAGSARAFIEKLNLQVNAVVWDGSKMFDAEGAKKLLPSEMGDLVKRYQNANHASVLYPPMKCVGQVIEKLGKAIRSFLDSSSKD